MRIRRFALVLLVAGLATLSRPPQANGQGGAAFDSVKFRNPKKDYQEDRVLGAVQETAGGIKVTAANKEVTEVAAGNIIAVDYGNLPGMDKIILDLRAAENQGNAAKARDLYAAEVKKNPADPKTKKFLEYREAYWTARTADEKTGPALQAEAPAAVAKLIGFVQEYSKKNAWEVWPVAHLAARMQFELGKYTEAGAIYSQLAKVEGLPPEMKFDAKLSETEMLFRSGNTLTTAPALEELSKAAGFPTAGSLREKLTILQAATKASGEKKPKEKPAAAVKVIDDVIAKTADPLVRSFGHNILGELYTQVDLPREAMWELLRVEVVDNQDHEEVLKAVIRLAECFQKQGDETRAKAYHDKLAQVKGA
ncbi:hypothetical protein [Limnoglobus roseus]|uniref:Tetratricopeptide repeat protein n=1 Tax=Limnoglobus roseus TaxID=2598579 RepID=A0A5C1AS86_9BACT|nr:hypothetical protein [Limnoglobus roseus]QEL20953.1 hypothetical protein PX52LOC_08081 [Limnoglobus roseus]